MTWKEMLMSFGIWVHGLIAAAISGGAVAISAAVIDPETFNIETGFKKLLAIGAVSAFMSVAAYLKQSPVPPISGNPPG